MKDTTPFKSHVPKHDLRANLEWRAKVMRDVIADPKRAQYYKAASASDIIFFINTFVWTFDPRLEDNKTIPFLLYDFQEDAILKLLEAIAKHDELIEKSRDMGASWLCIAVFVWCWLFVPGFSGLFVSRVEDLVDKAGNPKALFWKLDFLLKSLPDWLLPDGFDWNLHRSKLHIENPENGAVIDGESTTGNVARGDRRTAILLDEFAAVEQGHRVLSSTRDATNCRIFNSTPNGVNNAFYTIRQTTIAKLRLHWSQHPVKSEGLYTTDDNGHIKWLGKPIYCDDFHPILDGKLRSPWYDEQCTRAANSQEIAQELDIDYLGSGFQYFNSFAIEAAIKSMARPPFLIGDLDYDDATGDPTSFIENPKGHLKLWCLLDGSGKPSVSFKVVMGNDISAGTGASNSCSAGYNIVTCEKLFEYVNPYIRPEQFAKQGKAIGTWFNNAYMVWESYGPGRQFGSKLVELHYGNIYLRRSEEALSKKITDVPGWCPTKEGKLLVIGNYRDAVEKGTCINRSKDALQETLEYIHGPDGGVEHALASSKVDPSGARTNHGDRVIADALAWMLVQERIREPKPEKPEVPPGCLQWRINQRLEAQRKKERDGW